MAKSFRAFAIASTSCIARLTGREVNVDWIFMAVEFSSLLGCANSAHSQKSSSRGASIKCGAALAGFVAPSGIWKSRNAVSQGRSSRRFIGPCRRCGETSSDVTHPLRWANHMSVSSFIFDVHSMNRQTFPAQHCHYRAHPKDKGGLETALLGFGEQDDTLPR